MSMGGHTSDDDQSHVQADSQPATIDEQVSVPPVREKIPSWEWEDVSIQSWLSFPPEAEEKLEALFSGPSTQSLHKEAAFEMTQYGHTMLYTVDLHDNSSDSDGKTVWWQVDNATRSKQRVRRSEVTIQKTQHKASLAALAATAADQCGQRDKALLLYKNAIDLMCQLPQWTNEAAAKVDEYRRRVVTLQAEAVPSAPSISALARP